MTTIKELNWAFESYVAQMEGLGAVPAGARLVLSEGSKTYGRAFRVNLTGDGSEGSRYNSGHYRPLVGPEYLGMTKSEAEQTLWTARNTAADLHRHLATRIDSAVDALAKEAS